MKVALKNNAGFCGTAIYTVTQAKVAGAEEGCEWSFNFSYADGQANVYAWVVVEGTGEEVELVIAEDDNITHEGVVRFWEVLSKNVFKQAAFVRKALPDAILAWWKTPTAIQVCAERITVENLVRITEGPNDNPAVLFDVIVDGRTVLIKALEWINEKGVISEYCERNNAAWPEIFCQVADALDENDLNVVHCAIINRLNDALGQSHRRAA